MEYASILVPSHGPITSSSQIKKKRAKKNFFVGSRMTPSLLDYVLKLYWGLLCQISPTKKTVAD